MAHVLPTPLKLVARIARPESLAIGIARSRIAGQTAVKVLIASISHLSMSKNMSCFGIAGQHCRIYEGDFWAE